MQSKIKYTLLLIILFTTSTPETKTLPNINEILLYHYLEELEKTSQQVFTVLTEPLPQSFAQSAHKILSIKFPNNYQSSAQIYRRSLICDASLELYSRLRRLEQAYNSCVQNCSCSPPLECLQILTEEETLLLYYYDKLCRMASSLLFISEQADPKKALDQIEQDLFPILCKVIAQKSNPTNLDKPIMLFLLYLISPRCEEIVRDIQQIDLKRVTANGSYVLMCN